MKTLETPVLIVGGGPVGLSTALNLAQQGVESVLVEKHPTTAHHPKASYFNVRTMEILHQLGLADELYATALLAAGVSFYTNLSGYRLGAITGADIPEFVESVMAATARPGCVSSQIVLEAMLKEHADRHPAIRVLFDHEKVALEQDDRSVRTTIRDRTSGESFLVESQYTIACDGVHSSIREELGAAMVGPPAFGHMINIYIEADLESLVPDSGQALYWIASPRAPGVFIGLGGDGKKWCFNTPYLPDRGERA
jgi:2-polyprenyl-6-methoxyphenol hydroxylase-like FAD-dependent oxidoreductase